MFKCQLCSGNVSNIILQKKEVACCDSLVFAAGASIHPADQVLCVLGSLSVDQYAGLKSRQRMRASCLGTKQRLHMRRLRAAAGPLL